LGRSIDKILTGATEISIEAQHTKFHKIKSSKGRRYDPEIEVRELSTVLAKERSQEREAAQSGNI
jgi:hypothetical protein